MGEKLPVHGNEILGSFLAALSPEHHDRFFDLSALKDKNHPVNHIFSKAAFNTETGKLAMKLLETLIKTGLPGERLEELATRRHLNVQRACSMGNQGFLELLFKNFRSVPTKLLIHVAESPTHGTSIVTKLIHSGVVSLADFKNPDVMRYATMDVISTLSALEGRTIRQSDRLVGANIRPL